jgi:Ca-activated chloride channel homolog
MRKLAASLLTVGLSISVCGLRAQQPPTPQNSTPANTGSQNAGNSNSGTPTSGHQNSGAASSNTSSGQSGQGAPQKPDIITKVMLVNVYVTVTDNYGSPVGGLTKDNFVLSEDGLPQTIAVFDKESELPISIALDIDTSLSTRHDLPLELASAKRFVHTIMRPVDALDVYSFSEVVSSATHGFTPDLKRIDASIDHIHVGAATALYEAIWVASRDLDRRKGRKVIVLITDGDDTISKIDYQEAVRAAEEAEALVYSIIIVPIENSAGRETGGEHALIQLSEDTGGKYYYATSMAQLDDAFRKISDELRTQYLLAYYPSQRTSSSEFRRIGVKVTGVNGAADYHVRHRAGYYTVKAEF